MRKDLTLCTEIDATKARAILRWSKWSRQKLAHGIQDAHPIPIRTKIEDFLKIATSVDIGYIM